MPFVSAWSSPGAASLSVAAAATRRTGQIGARFGMTPTFLVLAALGILGVGLTLWLWPRKDPSMLYHTHPELPSYHPHLQEHGSDGHRHHFVIDDLHVGWPGKV